MPKYPCAAARRRRSARTTGTLAVVAIARHLSDTATAATMAFTTFVMFQLFNALAARSEDGPVLGRHQWRDRTLWISLAVVFVLQVIAVQLSVAEGVFDTVALTAAEWTVCVATASTVLLTEHLWRTVQTRLTRSRPT